MMINTRVMYNIMYVLHKYIYIMFIIIYIYHLITYHVIIKLTSKLFKIDPNESKRSILKYFTIKA